MPWHFICCRLVWHLGVGSEIPLLTYRAGSKRDALEKKAVLATFSTVCSHSVLGWCFWLAWGASGAGLHVLPWLQTDIGVLVSASVHPEASLFPVKATAWLFCVSCLSFLLDWDSPPPPQLSSLVPGRAEGALRVQIVAAVLPGTLHVKRRLGRTWGWWK